MTPSIRQARRVHTAMFNASITRSVVINDATRQPTIMREYTSMMNAAYTNPDHVATYVKSDTHNSLGRSASKRRLTRSGARGLVVSARVVIIERDRLAPRMPSSAMIRAMRSLSTISPYSRRNPALILRRP